MAVDPDSYNLYQDDESRGILWCGDRECRNYYRHAKPHLRLVHSDDFHRKCSEECNVTSEVFMSELQAAGIPQWRRWVFMVFIWAVLLLLNPRKALREIWSGRF